MKGVRCMLDIEIIDIDKDISTDANPQKWDNSINNSPINTQELIDRTNGYSTEEKQIVLGEIETDFLWDELRKREVHNRNVLCALRDTIIKEGVAE
jgi:hypothetical protein